MKLLPYAESNSGKPETDVQRQADVILENFAARSRQAKVLKPIARVRAWEGVRGAVQLVTAEDVWTAYRRLATAHAAAKAGGEFDGLLELHDDFQRLLTVWLHGPAA